MLVPGAPVSVDDVVDAARIVLGIVQRQTYMAWRENRWYNDDQLAAEVQRDRHDWQFRAYRFAAREHVFGLPIAQEILIAGLADTPLRVVSSLDQLGVHHQDSPDEDFLFAFGLMDRPQVFDPVRESGFPLSEVRIALKALGETRFLLMFAAGMTNREILAAAYSPERVDLDMLRTLAALRAPAS